MINGSRKLFNFPEKGPEQSGLYHEGHDKSGKNGCSNHPHPTTSNTAITEVFSITKIPCTEASESTIYCLPNIQHPIRNTRHTVTLLCLQATWPGSHRFSIYCCMITDYWWFCQQSKLLTASDLSTVDNSCITVFRLQFFREAVETRGSLVTLQTVDTWIRMTSKVDIACSELPPCATKAVKIRRGVNTMLREGRKVTGNIPAFLFITYIVLTTTIIFFKWFKQLLL